jgi:hypothetical protein
MTKVHTATLVFHFSDEVSHDEASGIVGNLVEHIWQERTGGISGFAKVTCVDAQFVGELGLRMAKRVEKDSDTTVVGGVAGVWDE